MQCRIEHLEYSNENVPAWYNYEEGPKKRPLRANNPTTTWIDMDDD